MECTVTWTGTTGTRSSMGFVAETGSGHVLTMDGAPDAAKPEDDSDEVADWFNTRTDPDIAEAVAKAEAAARGSLPAAGASQDLPGALELNPGTPEAAQTPPAG